MGRGGWNVVQNAVSIAEDTPFAEWCRVAQHNPEEIVNFRRHPLYAMVVPTMTNPENAWPWISALKAEYPHLLYNKKFFTKMVFGNPYMYEYEGFGLIDPVVFRMVYILGRLIGYFGRLEGFSICEIGPGNGILFKVITDMFPSARFTFVDLDGADYFLKKNIEFYGLEGSVDNHYTCKDVVGDAYKAREYDLVVSECAFNECYLPTQKIYADKIFRHSKRGKIHFNDEMYLHNRNQHMVSTDMSLYVDKAQMITDLTGEHVVWR